jgi:hypothetical protein
MDSDDVVDPGDAEVQALLALTAENNRDSHKHDLLINAILTLPPLTEWPLDAREKLLETCSFIKKLAGNSGREAKLLMPPVTIFIMKGT